MKKIISLLAIVFLASIGFAQDKTKSQTTIDGDDFTYEKIEITDRIEGNLPLKGRSNLNNKAKSISTSSKTSSGIGETMGDLSVSLSGGAVYNIPIMVPPGINGVQPEVSLAFNSQNGDGLAGYGWNINGISTISRIASTKFHDNEIDCVDFDGLDRFALDGQRLILKSGVYGGDGAEYETENYSNLKIQSIGQSNYGPVYFIVNYPDGSIAQYGNDTTSSKKIHYSIIYWENPQGVRVSYNYSGDYGSQHISNIKYGCIEDNTPLNSIFFNYHSRDRRDEVIIEGVRSVRTRILNNIVVHGNGSAYRKYYLNHDETNLNYNRLISVREENAQGESHSPIFFEYQDTSPSVQHTDIVTSLNLNDVEQRNSNAISLDLTANGAMDFIVTPKNNKNKFWIYKDLQSETTNNAYTVNGTFEDVFPVNIINSDNKVIPGQGLAVVQNVYNNQVKFKMYTNGTTNPIIYQYTKTWNSPTYTYQHTPSSSTVNRIPFKYLSGDFNGDGLSDVLAVGMPYSNQYCSTYACKNSDTGSSDFKPKPVQQKNESDESFRERTLKNTIGGGDLSNKIPDPDPIPDPDDGTCYSCYNYTANYNGVYFIDLKKNIASGYTNPAGFLNEVYNEETDQLHTADFNGDGKTDILHATNGKISVFSLNENNYMTLLWETTSSSSFIHPLYVGDYNGDGKADFINPRYDDSNEFKIFISTGNDFVVRNRVLPFTYKTVDFDTNLINGVFLYGYNLIPLDVNGDGKTDIVEYNTVTRNNYSNGSQVVKVYNNIGSFNLNTDYLSLHVGFEFGGETTKVGNLKHYPIPIFLSSSQPNKQLELASISDKWITNFSFAMDHREDVTLRSIENNGVKYKINYGSLNPEEYLTNTDFTNVYKPSYDAVYPNIDIKIAPTTKVVKYLERESLNNPVLTQKYFYKGAVANVVGRGFLGFEGIASTNWHATPSQAIYSVSKYDLDNRAAIVETYSKANYADFVTPTSGYISKTNFNYGSTLSANKVFKLWRISSLTQNALAGTNTSITYVYDSYNHPTKITTAFLGAGTNVVDITYDNSTGSNYYIGRPSRQIQTSTIGSETFSTETQFFYTNYLLTEKKVKGNNTPFNSEAYEYDAYGNLTKNTVSPYGEVPREINFEYDPFGRFMEKLTDLEGLETTYEYDPITGNLLNTTNPFGQTTTFDYDAWNRQIKVTDYLGKEIVTSFVEGGTQPANYYTITSSADDGSSSIQIYDPLKRLTKVKEKDILGQWVAKSFIYDTLDRPWKESEPYLDGSSPSQWNKVEYDVYNRPIQQTLHTGKIINIAYNGLSTTVNDGTKAVTTTKDAMNNMASVTDPGGTINYAYYGNGGLKTANYNGNIVSTEQDGWGRKTKLTDPSAGVYEYSYNGYGEILNETTPKGQTDYTYSPIGKLEEKVVSGDNTNMTIKYGYHPTNKMLASVTLTNADGNNSSYAYGYDVDQNLISTSESNIHAQFSTEYTYDTFGRIETEQYNAQLLSNNATSTKKIRNSYQNGGVKAIKDFSTNSILYDIASVNARGQITMATMGNSMQEQNTYNALGYLTETKVDKDARSSPVELMKLTNNFDAQRGTLTSRTNSLFSWSETFGYDNLDRLITFNDNDSDKSHTYDSKGRILVNDIIGDYNYAGNAYQLGNVNLNNQGDLYYQQNVLQNVTYNAFKKPTKIEAVGKEKINFQYNAFMGRSHMYYGGTEDNVNERDKRKHYSYDGSMEISYDAAGTTKTTFVTYIGGDAYSAPVIWKSEQAFTEINDFYYLHRDYLGSILMITNSNGTIKEKRHFDAWGNIVRVADGNNNSLDKLEFLDRGYTGHEHLQGVNLIHMNGRLYDPKLRRFLAPDNYIQDITNTQNFNRYGYVLNNPLMYVDPSGETGEVTGMGGGWISAIAAGATSAYYALKGVDFRGARNWIGTNAQSVVRDVVRPIREIGRWFKKVFGGKEKDPVTIYGNTSNLTSDPLAGSTNAMPSSAYGGGGIDGGGLGITDFQTNFTVGAVVGAYRGVLSSWDFVKSLTTAQGWQAIGDGIVNLGHMVTQYSGKGMYLRSQLAQSVTNYVNNIPNMTALEMGMDYGFGMEKVVETVLVSRGTSLAVNGVRGLATTNTVVRAIGAAPRGFSKFKSVNQLNKLVQTGKLPKTITRFDKGKIFGELDHVHFDNGAALNINGTWKHGFKILTNKEIKILSQNGWILPE